MHCELGIICAYILYELNKNKKLTFLTMRCKDTPKKNYQIQIQ
jgi:hypothetical protein